MVLAERLLHHGWRHVAAPGVALDWERRRRRLASHRSQVGTGCRLPAWSDRRTPGSKRTPPGRRRDSTRFESSSTGRACRRRRTRAHSTSCWKLPGTWPSSGQRRQSRWRCQSNAVARRAVRAGLVGWSKLSSARHGGRRCAVSAVPNAVRQRIGIRGVVGSASARRPTRHDRVLEPVVSPVRAAVLLRSKSSTAPHAHARWRHVHFGVRSRQHLQRTPRSRRRSPARRVVRRRPSTPTRRARRRPAARRRTHRSSSALRRRSGTRTERTRSPRSLRWSEQFGYDGHWCWLAQSRTSDAHSTRRQNCCQRSSHRVAARVQRWGHVSDAEKWWLLRHAQLVLYPSVVEGFGLVPFEAAAVGTPCLAHAGTAPGELLGGTSAVMSTWSPLTWAARADQLIRHRAAMPQTLVAEVVEAANSTRGVDVPNAPGTPSTPRSPCRAAAFMPTTAERWHGFHRHHSPIRTPAKLRFTLARGVPAVRRRLSGLLSKVRRSGAP